MAEDLLQALKKEQIDAVLPYLRSMDKEPEKAVGKEKDLIVFSWRIVNRKIENDGRYCLSYLAKQKGFDFETPIGFYFVKNQDNWELAEIEAIW